MYRPTNLVPLLVIAALLPARGAMAAPATQAPTARTTVVMSFPDDPYRPLAEDIGRLESIPLVDSLEAALAAHPTFLLWVVSPGRLSDRVMVAFNGTVDRQPSRVSYGLITGSTIDKARELYARRTAVSGARTVTVLGKVTFGGGRIVEADGDRRGERPLTDVRDVLASLDAGGYLHYDGHGGPSYWRPLEDGLISFRDVPPLRPVVVSAYSCNTARVWDRSSIGLRFIDQGAAAYLGFYYSPMAGFQAGEQAGPFRHTWPGVPIGHVVQTGSAGALKGYAAVTMQVLLGDPRIALNSEPPCRFVDSGDAGTTRTVTCRAAPAGLIPVLVPGGGRYRFIGIPGRTAISTDDGFYNRLLQTTTIGEDRVVLVEHEGGDLHLRFDAGPGPAWRVRDGLLDAVDYNMVGMADRRHGGDVIALLLGAVAALLVGCRKPWRPRTRPYLLPAAAVGALAASLHAAYGLLRDADITSIGKAIVFSPLAAVGTGLLVACGALMFLAARSWRGRLAGLVTATSMGWISGAITWAMAARTNAIIAKAVGLDSEVYTVEWHPFGLALLGCAILFAVFSGVRRVLPTGQTTERRAGV